MAPSCTRPAGSRPTGPQAPAEQSQQARALLPPPRSGKTLRRLVKEAGAARSHGDPHEEWLQRLLRLISSDNFPEARLLYAKQQASPDDAFRVNQQIQRKRAELQRKHEELDELERAVASTPTVGDWTRAAAEELDSKRVEEP